MTTTNITDTPGDGSTETTLVTTHDRGSREYNTRVGGGDPFGPEGDPHISSLTPPATSQAAGTTQITVAGEYFEATSKVEIDGAAQTTTFVSDTSLTVNYAPASTGTKEFTVRNASGAESNSVAFMVNA